MFPYMVPYIPCMFPYTLLKFVLLIDKPSVAALHQEEVGCRTPDGKPPVAHSAIQTSSCCHHWCGPPKTEALWAPTSGTIESWIAIGLPGQINKCLDRIWIMLDIITCCKLDIDHIRSNDIE